VSAEKQANVPGQRVYEYQTEDGTVFYSFHRYPSRIMPPMRLYLESRLGKHLNNFLVEMRRRGHEMATAEEDGVVE
jgi:hypothetical protein